MPRFCLLVAFWAALWLPPLGPVLRSTMSGQMLIQFALLVATGFAMGNLLLRSNSRWLQLFRTFRWALLIVATLTLGIWMIPRMLDLAVESLFVEVVKAASLTFLGGVPLCLAWKSFGPVLHGLIHVEAAASIFRLAWLYLDSPVRLCTQYLYNDQIILGNSLIVVGGLYLLWLIYIALGGRALRET